MPGVFNNNEAFVTLVTNAEYGLGAAVLGHKLRSGRTSRPTVAMVTESVPETTRQMLSHTWSEVVDVSTLHSNDTEALALLKRPELGITFSKLNVWKLTQYKKVVFVDADTMPLCNIDPLFDFEELSACRDVGWPDCFNTGLFVLKPSLDTYNSLLRRAMDEGSFDGGDQGLLNAHFSGWSRDDITKHIPFSYNVNPNASYTYLPAYKHFAEDVKMVHFLGAVKPWHYQFSDGQVLGHNMTDHTRAFLEEWHKTAEIVKQSYNRRMTTPTSKVTYPEKKSTDTEERYVPPISAHFQQQTSVTSSQEPEQLLPADDVTSMLAHITSQIKDKERNKSTMY